LLWRPLMAHFFSRLCPVFLLLAFPALAEPSARLLPLRASLGETAQSAPPAGVSVAPKVSNGTGQIVAGSVLLSIGVPVLATGIVFLVMGARASPPDPESFCEGCGLITGFGTMLTVAGAVPTVFGGLLLAGGLTQRAKSLDASKPPPTLSHRGVSYAWTF
jgi:hypothetical protein